MFTSNNRNIGRISAFAVFMLLIIYAVTTVLGFVSLDSANDPIGDPYFTLMEVLIILIAPAMLVCMVSVYFYVAPAKRIFSLIAIVFMILLTTITSGVHFVILTVSRTFSGSKLNGIDLLFSFQWPSIVYALDILAWDWFFALSMLFAAPGFTGGRLENAIRLLMIVSGLLSLIGLLGVPLANMQIRNIGIFGYTIVAMVVFLLLGILFHRLSVDAE